MHAPPRPRPRPGEKRKTVKTRILEANPNASEEDALRVSRNIHRRLREQSQR
jgi:hypothetical protein